MASAGLVTILLAHLVFPIVAFRVRWYWAVVCLFVPLGWVIFSAFNWAAARRTALFTGGALVTALAIFIVRSFVVAFFETPVA